MTLPLHQIKEKERFQVQTKDHTPKCKTYNREEPYEEKSLNLKLKPSLVTQSKSCKEIGKKAQPRVLISIQCTENNK
jgi:hypothetical protein